MVKRGKKLPNPQHVPNPNYEPSPNLVRVRRRRKAFRSTPEIRKHLKRMTICWCLYFFTFYTLQQLNQNEEKRENVAICVFHYCKKGGNTF